MFPRSRPFLLGAKSGSEVLARLLRGRCKDVLLSRNNFPRHYSAGSLKATLYENCNSHHFGVVADGGTRIHPGAKA